MISNRCARKSLVTNCNSIISKNYLRFLVDSNDNDSFLNVIGCSLAMGPVFIYIDYAIGRNHAWIGNNWNNAFAQCYDNTTNARFNINMGYYF